MADYPRLVFDKLDFSATESTDLWIYIFRSLNIHLWIYNPTSPPNRVARIGNYGRDGRIGGSEKTGQVTAGGGRLR
jgi:hypothetical protein